MKVIALGTKTEFATKSDPSHMHKALDALRKRIDSGEIVAFVAAAINTEDGVYAYCGADKAAHVTRLRMQGALAKIQHAYLNGELVEGDTV